MKLITLLPLFCLFSAGTAFSADTGKIVSCTYHNHLFNKKVSIKWTNSQGEKGKDVCTPNGRTFFVTAPVTNDILTSYHYFDCKSTGRELLEKQRASGQSSYTYKGKLCR